MGSNTWLLDPIVGSTIHNTSFLERFLMGKPKHGKEKRVTTIDMTVNKVCKSCTRFATDDDDAAISNVYIDKEWLEENGNPKEVTITLKG